MALSHIYSLDSVPVAISQIEDYSSEGYYQFVTSSDTSSFSPPGELRLGSPIDPPDGTSLPPPSPLPPGDVNHLFNSEGTRCSTWCSQECSESESVQKIHVTTLVGCMQQCALFVTFGACD